MTTSLPNMTDFLFSWGWSKIANDISLKGHQSNLSVWKVKYAGSSRRPKAGSESVARHMPRPSQDLARDAELRQHRRVGGWCHRLQSDSEIRLRT